MNTKTYRNAVVASVSALLVMAATMSTAVADWPQWRGPDRTDISTETGLLKKWPASGPKLDWKIDSLGIGHAGPAIVGDKMFIMSDRGQGEELHCLSTNGGRMLWSTKIGTTYNNRWGDGPRSTPTVDGQAVYVMGSKGELACVDGRNGKVVWTKSLNSMGGKTEGWGYTQSPLVDGNLVIASAGGKGPVYAFDKRNGNVVWKTKGFRDSNHYSSMIAIDHNGKRQYVKLRDKSLVGIDARSGDILWTAPWHGRTAVIPTPIYKDGHVYIASGYGQGCMLVKIAPDSGSAEIVYDNKVMKNHHGGVILVGDHLYGYSDGAGWVCQDFMSGEMVWNDRSLGKGSCTYADGMLYLYSEGGGECVLIEASPAGWKEHGRFTIPQKTKHDRKSGKIWVHPVVSDGKLYLRDQELLFCFDVRR